MTQLLVCVLSGFASIPAVILFGLDPTAGKGLIFQSLPVVFSRLSGGMIWFFLFMLAIFFAGLSTTISMLEIPVTCLMDSLKWSRTKAIAVLTVLACLGAIPCVWSDACFAFVDNLIGDVFYCVTAAVGPFTWPGWWAPGRCAPSGYNPTSIIKYGSWVDVLYKFAAVPAFAYFAITAILSLF